MTTKLCTKCLASKPRSEFHTRRASPDGLVPICKPCAIAKSTAWYLQNKDRKKIYDKKYQTLDRTKRVQAAYRIRTRDRAAAKARKWYAENTDRAKAYAKTYFNLHRDKYLAKLREWGRSNPGKVNSNTARRRALKLSATPGWANTKEIAKFYIAARAAGFQVDHIVPLRSRLVCGLHVEANLRVIPAFDNQSKSNRAWPDMP